MAKFNANASYDVNAQKAYNIAGQNIFGRIGQMYGNELIGTPGMLAGGPDAAGQLARLRKSTLAAGVTAGANQLGDLGSNMAMDRLQFIKSQIAARQAKDAAKGSVFKKIGGAALGAGIGFLTGGPVGAIAGGASSLLGTPNPMPAGGIGGATQNYGSLGSGGGSSYGMMGPGSGYGSNLGYGVSGADTGANPTMMRRKPAVW